MELAIALGLEAEASRSTSRPRACRARESHIILDAIDALPKHIGVLIIDHDMELVFRFAQEDHRAGAAAGCSPRARRTRSAPIRASRAVYLGQATIHGPPWLTRSQLQGCLGGLRRDRGARRTSILARAGRDASASIGRNGVGKTTLLATVDGPHPLHKATVTLGRRSHQRACRSIARVAGLGYRAAGARDLSVADACSKTSRSARAARAPGPRSGSFELFPSLKERLDNCGNQLSGGEQQMLVDRARAADQPVGAA